MLKWKRMGYYYLKISLYPAFSLSWKGDPPGVTRTRYAGRDRYHDGAAFFVLIYRLLISLRDFWTHWNGSIVSLMNHGNRGFSCGNKRSSSLRSLLYHKVLSSAFISFLEYIVQSKNRKLSIRKICYSCPYLNITLWL